MLIRVSQLSDAVRTPGHRATGRAPGRVRRPTSLLGAGYSSLFAYCTEALRLPEHGAYNRIEAARGVRRFPRVLSMLAEGALNLATVRLLAAHLTTENQDGLLDAAQGKSRRQVEDLIARRFPRPDGGDSVRKLPTPTGVSTATVAAPQPQASMASAPEHPTVPANAAPSTISLPSPAHRGVVEALAPDRYLIKFTAGARTCEKLRTAQDLLQHAVPTRDIAEVVDRALAVLIEHLERRKFGRTERPGSARGTKRRSRHIPAEVRRVVWSRDGGQCAFVSADGRRCSARSHLEFHHLTPYEVGGPSTVDNIQLRCRAHEADLYHGGFRAAAEASTRPGTSSGGVGNMTM